MKYFDEVINKYLKWNENGENGDMRFILPSRDGFELYRLENPDVPPLTEEQGKYIDILYKVTLLNKAANGAIKAEVAKLILGNDYGYIDRPKQKEDDLPNYVVFDCEGLYKDCTVNHEGESLENDAIKDMKNNNDEEMYK